MPLRHVGGLCVALLAIASVTPAGAEITYAGSSTIAEHIMPEAMAAFTARTGVRFARPGTQGSTRGLEMVVGGETQVGGVARSLSADERRLPIDWLIIGYDAVQVCVHPSNRVKSLSKEELKRIFTGRITRWNEVGGSDAPITVITTVADDGRGALLEFQRRVMGGLPYRPDRREVDDQTALGAALADRRHGVATLSPPYAGPRVRCVAIEGVPPRPENVRSGAYILSRPLILVAPARPAAEVRGFLDFMLGPEGQAIVARKFVAVR